VPTPAETFAANLRRLRLERGLTQEQLGLDAGMTMADIGAIETQGREPRVTTIAKLAAALDVDPGELFRS
jgi:transcriptional regulator with XRE-family HTH domain